MFVRYHMFGQPDTYPYLMKKFEEVDEEASVYLDRDMPDDWTWFNGGFECDLAYCQGHDVLRCFRVPAQHFNDHMPEQLWLTDGHGRMLIWENGKWRAV